MRVVFAGTPSVAVPSLRALHASTHDVVAVMTRADAPVGRKRILTSSPVALAAEELGIPVIRSSRPDAATEQAVRALDPDAGVVVAYGALLSSSMLSIPRHGWLNLHFSDLPSWRGAAPVQRAILAGDEDSVTTVFRLDEGMDTGDVCSREVSEFGADETASQALRRLSLSGAHQIVSDVTKLEAGKLVFIPQSGVATLAPKILSSEGRIMSSMTADEAYRRIRAMSDEPGAFVETARGRIKIIESRMRSSGTPGRGTITLNDTGVVAELSHGSIELLTVQPAGRLSMSAVEWLRGVPGGSVEIIDS